MRRSRTALAAVLAAGLATSAAAEPMSLNSMRFEAPPAAAGWTSSRAKSGMIFKREVPPAENENRKGAAMIQILGPFAERPDGFDRNFERVAGMVEGMAGERPMLKSAGLTTNGHRIRADFRCCVSRSGTSISQRTVGIASAGRQVFLTFLDLRLKGAAQDKAEADFAALVRSIRIEAADKPFELVPGADDGGLDGVYTHLESGVVPNAFGGVDFSSKSAITVFDSSGLFATVLPEGGDIRAHCRAHFADCGLYKLTGGGILGGARTIEMRSVADDFGTLETDAKPFAAKGADLEIDGTLHAAVPPPPAGTPFQGTWRYFFASSGSTATSSGAVSSERILALGRDGRFRRTGFSGASASHSTGGGTSGFSTGRDRPAETGRYAVEGYALTLTGDDGRSERLSLFLPEAGSDKLLVIDGANYLKRD